MCRYPPPQPEQWGREETDGGGTEVSPMPLRMSKCPSWSLLRRGTLMWRAGHSLGSLFISKKHIPEAPCREQGKHHWTNDECILSMETRRPRWSQFQDGGFHLQSKMRGKLPRPCTHQVRGCSLRTTSPKSMAFQGCSTHPKPCLLPPDAHDASLRPPQTLSTRQLLKVS